MIRVSKEEAAAIRLMAPESHVTVVNRQSNHKKYFVEENRETDAILRDMRKENVIYQAGNFDPKPRMQQKPIQKPKHDENRHRHSAGYNGPRADRPDKPKEQWSKPQNKPKNFQQSQPYQKTQGQQRPQSSQRTQKYQPRQGARP